MLVKASAKGKSRAGVEFLYQSTQGAGNMQTDLISRNFDLLLPCHFFREMLRNDGKMALRQTGWVHSELLKMESGSTGLN